MPGRAKLGIFCHVFSFAENRHTFVSALSKPYLLKLFEKMKYRALHKMRCLFLLLLTAAGSFVFSQTPATDTASLPVLEFLPEGGFYGDSLSVQLLAPGANIYYTTNGNRPAEIRQHSYTGPVPVTRTTVIRAIVVDRGKRSHVVSHTYFIGEPPGTFSVVSIAISPRTLFDPEDGLFMKGEEVVDSLWYKPGANFWSRRETSASVEIFETDGTCAWRHEAGFRLFGGMSRIFPQKSLSIIARDEYGENRIRYSVFGKKGLKKFKYLVLRNSGSDFGQTHFRDALMTSLVKNWDLDMQDYRPAHVYLDGKYWGIYNLREKLNRYYVASHYPVDKDSIDLIEHRLNRRRGSTAHYESLLGFMKNNSLAGTANFAYVNARMEVNNFMDLQIAQIYCDNQDAGGNIRFWRPQTETGRWRWMLFDTDWGFGLSDPRAYRNNSLAFHTKPNGPYWPNPPWSTFILRKLLENKDFERRFINRFADYLNSDLASEKVLLKIDEFYRRLLPEMPRHLKRWRLKEERWHSEVEVMRTFAQKRPAYLRRFFMEKFDTGGLRWLEVGTMPGGQVIVNENLVVRDTFAGQYFEKIPIRLKAIPGLGYRFAGWRGTGGSVESTALTLELTRPHWQLRAVFEKFEHPLAGKIIINEVSCNNKKSSDWVEIYNSAKERVNLQDWILTDSKNEFRFPPFTLPPKGYVVVCEDSADFVKVHPDALSVIGGLNFGLNKKHETIQLFSPDASAVDSMGYVLEPMDSVFTLNLLLPTLDNGDPGNWEITPGTGSPGAANAYYLASRIQYKRQLWMQIGGAMGVILLCLFLLVLRAKGRL
jgi:CotH kinase protein/Lamin Tail Domain/Chitobiase/beta-hexosaminidase C-terminal domain